MQISPQVTFLHIPRSAAILEACQREASKLERYCANVARCEVVVSRPHRRHHQGNGYAVHILLRAPGGDLAVASDRPDHRETENAYRVIRQAFNRARRQLEEYVERRRGRSKTRQTRDSAGGARNPS